MKKLLFVLIAGLLVCAPSSNISATCGLCGDLNGDGSVNVGDLVAFGNWYYSWPPVTPACPLDADMNCDGSVTVGVPGSDLSILNDYIFNNGPAPCDPVAFPGC